MSPTNTTRLVVTFDGLKLKLSQDESRIIRDLQRRGLSAREAFAFVLVPDDIALLDRKFAKGERVTMETVNA